MPITRQYTSALRESLKLHFWQDRFENVSEKEPISADEGATKRAFY
jgi:hypothetical protein